MNFFNRCALLLFSLAVFAACVPDTRPTDLVGPPAESGPFAKLAFDASPEKVFVALRDSIENGTGNFLLIGLYKERDGLQAFWQKIAGQSARVYFTIKANAGGSQVKAAVVPLRPEDPQGLAVGIDKVAFEVAQALGLKNYLLEPDR